MGYVFLMACFAVMGAYYGYFLAMTGLKGEIIANEYVTINNVRYKTVRIKETE